MNEKVFALDIGTQSVSGILLQKQNKTYQVIDYYIKHHEERSMLDGQIQYVMKVAEVIRAVKEKLEEEHGPLTEVCVAAAGRALKTIKTEKTISILNQTLTSKVEINHLELSAVQQAQLEIVKKHQDQFTNYHCVGYSVLHYYLDGEPIGSLINQTGKEASVEVITTFLPKVVIESLIAALEQANLKIHALTLEPIAAIHVLVPASMRRLNVALVDIGAGTSDIAIANDGTVIAYGMVPVAGDEITEAVSDSYLLDFKEAEIAKQQIVNEGSTVVQDILGFDTEITLKDLSEKVEDQINHLASLLRDKIITLNGKIPQAVMLIGGGSLTPMLTEKIARFLQLPNNRVAIRGIDGITSLDKDNKKELPAGPEFVTPIGIAIGATQHPLHYTNVTVNGHAILMFNTKALTIGDCLIQSGIDINKYYGRIGLSYIITVNGQKTTLRGKYGKGPIILLNGSEANVNNAIHPNDDIQITKGEDGSEPIVQLKDVLGEKDDICFTFNGNKHHLKIKHLVNGEPVPSNYQLKDNDIVTETNTANLSDFLSIDFPRLLHTNTAFEVMVNNQKLLLPAGAREFLINNRVASPSDIIQEGDNIMFKEPEKVTIQTIETHLNKDMHHSIQITFNGEPVTLSQQIVHFFRQDRLLTKTTEVMNGDTLTFKEIDKRPFIFQDVFRYIEIETNKGTYQIYINDIPAGFHDEIVHGSRLEIVWG